MAKFKIDMNSYDSDTYPVALWKWRPDRFFGGQWKHYQSFESKEKAREHYEKIKDFDKGLPIFLPPNSGAS